MAQRTPGFALFTDPDGRFSVEFPNDWRWMMVSPSQEALVTFVQPRSEAALVVERVRLKQSLANDEITELFAQIESDILKENQPKATKVAARMISQGGRRIVVIDYTRPGLGEDERVRQSSFPVAENLYSVTCMALASEFQEYALTFATVAESSSAGELGTTSARGR